jgi:Protein of unknown function (DUF3223)
VTKKEKTARCRALLHGAALFVPIRTTDARFDELRALLQGHRHWDRKVGCGIASFEVRPAAYGNRCFWIVRTDGKETDISFVQALSPTSQKQDVQRAMRAAVEDQCAEFRLAHNVPAGWHVDHVVPLDKLTAEYLAAAGLTWDAVPIESDDGDVGSRITDLAFVSEWQRWHRAHAQLQGLPAAENLRKGNR